MRKASQSQAQSCTLAKKDQPIPSPPKLSDRYIIVCPVFFKTVLKEKLEYMDGYDLRDSKQQYLSLPEDQWGKTADREVFYAVIYRADTGEKIIYYEPQGRLYSCQDIIEVGRTLEELKAQEALKIIPRQSP